MAKDEMFFPQAQVASVRVVAVRHRLFYSFPLDSIIDIFVLKFPDMITKFCGMLLIYIGK